MGEYGVSNGLKLIEFSVLMFLKNSFCRSVEKFAHTIRYKNVAKDMGKHGVPEFQ